MVHSVNLRKKVIGKNRYSLYLDFYPAILLHDGEELTRRKFLKRFVFSEVVKGKDGVSRKIKLSATEKLHNSETMLWAEQVRQKWDNEINKPEIYTGHEKEQLKIRQQGEKDFVEYFKTLVDKRKGNNFQNWQSSFKYFSDFVDNKLKFSKLNLELCEEFKEYLLTTPSRKSAKALLKINSAKSYFDKFKAVLKAAYKYEYLQTDLNSRVDSIKEEETHRVYISKEQLDLLAKADCENEVVKQASLFSALTGIRYSDIEKLIWKDVTSYKNEGYDLKFTQQKTGGAETLPISLETFKLLGKEKLPNEKVFHGLKYTDCIKTSRVFSNWLAAAGISSDFTFHCFRHTFAVLQLIEGTDIYVLSKMLGHKFIKTTQIYAKVVDSKKREAAERIKLDY